jgi:phosphatidylglycerophosphate synthase
LPASIHSPERRPLCIRDQAWARACASWLARRGVSPNAFSLAGLACAGLAGLALALTPHVEPPWRSAALLAAAGLVPGRLLANMLDGMVALEQGRASPVGELFNEVPDRLSDAAVLVGAGYAVGAVPELGFVAALLALFIAYVRAEGKVAGAHQEFCGPMAKQQRMAVVVLACPAAALFADLPVMSVALGLIVVGEVVTVVRRLARIGAALRRGRP